MPDTADGQAPTDQPLGNLDAPDSEATPDSDKAQAPGYKYKGKSLKPEDVQSVLQQAEHLDRLRGELGTRIGEKDKQIAELSERMARMEGAQEATTPQQDGQKFLDSLLDNPDRAYQQLKADAVAEARAELLKEMDGFKQEVSNTVNSQATVNSFFDRYPDMRPYEQIRIGKTSLVGAARDELTDRAQREGWLGSLSDSNYAFDMLQKEVHTLANRLGIKPPESKPEAPPRDVTERGHTHPLQTPPRKDSFTRDDMRKEMLDAYRGLRDRIRPANTKI